jgi:hypothetical protein
MLKALEFLASLCCALFAGAAIYINLVEHPARMGCDTKIAATVWAPGYKRAAVMQATLAILSFLAGSAAWLLGGGIMWLAGAVIIGLVVPFTLLVIKPTNDQLLDPARDPGVGRDADAAGEMGQTPRCSQRAESTGDAHLFGLAGRRLMWPKAGAISRCARLPIASNSAPRRSTSIFRTSAICWPI